ncbi:MAG: DUF4270 family protein [Bacteroidetes bacterium]|nr:DUF4270 family protein [Bacteroidota bacterium]
MRTTEKNVLKPYLLIVLFPLMAMMVLAACQKPVINFGTSLVNNSHSNNSNIVEVDTLSVQLSTVLRDSFATASTGTMLLGHYHDNIMGSVTASSFFQLGTPTGTAGIDILSVYDSLVLMMRINKSYYGDTTLSQRYYVSQLNDLIQLPLNTNQVTFYNNSSFPYNPKPLGFTDVTIFPTRGMTSQSVTSGDTVKIVLPDTLGQHLMNMIYGNSDTITTLNSFLSYFRGLTVYPDTTAGHSGVMYGFKDTVTMRMFYHQPGAYATYKFVDFRFNNKANQFNRIVANRSGTVLGALDQAQAVRTNNIISAEVPSSNMNNACYVQPGTGILGKIRLPSLASITALPGYLQVVKAQLIMKPVMGTFNLLTNLPPQLELYYTDQNNQLGSPIISNGSVQYGNLYYDFSGAANTQYTFDITNFVKQQLSIGGVNYNGLMIGLPAPASYSTFNKAVFGDATNKIYNISVKLFYVSLPQ